MVEKYDIVVVGGGPAGIITANTAKALYPDKKVLVIRPERRFPIPCAIPYIFHSIGTPEKNVIPNEALTKKGVELLFDEVTEIDREKKVVKTKGGKEIGYEKLVLAIGAKPFVPPIKGTDLKGVYTIKKDVDFLVELFNAVKEAKKIAIIGGGFIGVETADDIVRMGKEVHIIEIGPKLLGGVFDPEFAELVEEELKKLGVKIHTNSKVKEIVGKEKVEKVVLESGEEIEADLVIIATGVRPNSELAKKAGLAVTEYGAIAVDEYMRTSDPDIFAVGDCAAKKLWHTGTPSKALLASVATIEARVAALNLYGIKTYTRVVGTIGIFSTKVGDVAVGVAGLTEGLAKKLGYEYIVGEAEAVNRHPGVLPGGGKMKVKLLFTKDDLKIIGGEVAGPEPIGEVINIIGALIQMGATAYDVFTMQFGTHPKLTAAPTVYPIIIAAFKAIQSAKKK